MEQIAELGHEIGYHYEDVDLVSQQFANSGIRKFEINNLIDAAYESFCKNLEMFRKNFDIKTICMHGSPLSKYDNKLLWTKYDYRGLGIIGEPYMDTDFSKVFYITDTGRAWNKELSSVRDKVKSPFNIHIKNTRHLIHLAETNQLPAQIMITIHPQRWTNNPFKWTEELILQNVKNVVKKIIARRGEA
ncbi:MAG: hypothetical protein Kow0068_12040 [Marinilabiliales bacterium]